MPVFYPSVVANLIIRFDEALLNGDMPSTESAVDLAAATGGAPGEPNAKAGLLDGADDRLSHVLAIMPRSATIELPSYRQASKFNLTFAFRDFPIDPRAIRALGVEIYIGTVSSDDFARGMNLERDNGRLASLMRLTPENLRLAGTADSIVAAHTDKGTEIQIEGRGLQGVFLDARIDASTLKDLDLEQPIHMVVAQVLARAPDGLQIPVGVNDDEWPGGLVPAPAAEEVVSRINKGATGEHPGMPMKGDTTQLNVWDIITNFCFLVGAVPYFDGHELLIRPARSLFDQRRAGQPGNPTPFLNGQPRTVATSRGKVDFRTRKMVYGRNLQSFKLERKLGGTKVPTIRCVSVDPGSPNRGKGKLVEVEWPALAPGTSARQVDKAKVTSVAPSGKTATQDVMTIPVPGIKDPERLREIARNLYEEIGRGELGGSASTKDLTSFGGDNEDADIIRLKPGDAVDFYVDATGLQGLPPVVSELNLAAEKSAEALSAFISEKLGGRKDLADVLVGTLRGRFRGLQTTFRTANVKYAWEAGTGIAVDFDFQNYVEARYDVLSEQIDTLTENVGEIAQRMSDQAAARSAAPPKITSKGGR